MSINSVLALIGSDDSGAWKWVIPYLHLGRKSDPLIIRSISNPCAVFTFFCFFICLDVSYQNPAGVVIGRLAMGATPKVEIREPLI